MDKAFSDTGHDILQVDGQVQEPMVESSPVQAHLSRLNILVKDMGKALAFYQLLGFSFEDHQLTEDYVEVQTPNGFRISWWQRGDMKGVVPDKPFSGYRVEIAICCPGRSGVDSVHERIVKAGYSSVRSPFDAPWGQRYAFVEDPDGNLVGLEEHCADTVTNF